MSTTLAHDLLDESIQTAKLIGDSQVILDLEHAIDLAQKFQPQNVLKAMSAYKGGKIHMIKEFRSLTGLGLRESKNMIETIFDPDDVQHKEIIQKLEELTKLVKEK